MFLELPITRWNENLRANEDISISINPFQIVSIEPSEDDPDYSILWMTNGGTIEVNLQKKVVNARIKNFIRENVLQKIYKEMRSGQN